MARGARLVAQAWRRLAAAGRCRGYWRRLAWGRQRGLGSAISPLPGALPGALPPGDYRFASTLRDAEFATLAWLAGSDRFGRYKSENNANPKRLVLPGGVDRGRVQALAEALFLGRDLINTPSNDLGPARTLKTATRDIGAEHGAAVKVTEGSGLLADNFPMIYAVGRASDRAPRLIDLRWGSEGCQARPSWAKAFASIPEVSTSSQETQWR